MQISDEFKDEFVAIFVDKAAWNTTAKLIIPENVHIEFLPPYSPQLNPVEVLWKELRKDHFHNKVFENMDAVDEQLEIALRNMATNHARIRSFSAFSWMLM